MLPSVVASELEQVAADAIRTAFHPTTPGFAGLIGRFLADREQLLKGPYVSVALPFHQGSGRNWFPQIPLPFPPYRHQEKAFDRLLPGSPRNTLVATGTGSGKTECFLLPLLEHCRQQQAQGVRGIKAILIYPMNALATDQARRIADLIHTTAALAGLRAGLYIGSADDTPTAAMTATSVITDKEALHKAPPDLLLTNYKQLDYLLIQPQVQSLWQHNHAGVLRYLVVDEFHTFDGAQGTDLACLIRRLRDRLHCPGEELVCVGTSATLGGSKSRDAMLAYAGQIFASRFEPAALIEEERLSPEEFFAEHTAYGDEGLRMLPLPGVDAVDQLDPEHAAGAEAYIAAQAALWLADVLPPPPQGTVNNDDWRLALGRQLGTLPAVHNLVRQASGTCSIEELLERFSRQLGLGDRYPRRYRVLLLDSLLALIAHARRTTIKLDGEAVVAPWLNLRVQLWLRELKRMVASVEAEPRLRHSDDLAGGDGSLHLPVVHCRDCGATAWASTVLNSGSNRLDRATNLRGFYKAFFSGAPELRYLFPQSRPGTGHQLCAGCLSFHPSQELADATPLGGLPVCPSCQSRELLPVDIPDCSVLDEHNHPRVSRDCPYCNAQQGLLLIGSSAANLTSTWSAALFASAFNGDKKLLAFSDSVQDAAHRAGFIAARAYRTCFRTALTTTVRQAGAPLRLDQLQEQLISDWQQRFPNPVNFAATFIPHDLEWLREWDALQQQLTPTLDATGTLMRFVADRLRWEVAAEFGYRARLGSSVEQAGALAAAVDPTAVNRLLPALLSRLQNEIEPLRGLRLGQLQQFVVGLLQHLRQRGALALPDLVGRDGKASAYLESGGANTYPFNQIPYLPGFGRNSTRPIFLTSFRGKGSFEQLVRDSGHPTWAQHWLERTVAAAGPLAAEQQKEALNAVVEALCEAGLLLQFSGGRGERIWAIPPAAISVSSDPHPVRCEHCGDQHSVPTEQLSLWDGLPCQVRHCPGRYRPDPRGGLPLYRRLYQRGEVHRIVAREHTGLLERGDRERLETQFIRGEYRSDPNLLSATSTLEMGINIGDLSTVLLASVPPEPANYLQRIGRAGRRDGNAMVGTLVTGTAHDLYFFSDPREMLQGQVNPPGCYLDAAAILRRQLLAYGLDRWVASGLDHLALPRKLKPVLDGVEKAQTGTIPEEFPYTWLGWVQAHQAELLERFCGLFGEELQPASRADLQQFLLAPADGGGDGAFEAPFAAELLARLRDLVAERKRLGAEARKLRERYNKLCERPDDSLTPEERDAKDSIRREQFAYNQLRKELDGRPLLAMLTDEGFLPNYAFPEAGVTLKSVLWRKLPGHASSNSRGDGRRSEDLPPLSYERPANVAIRELVPDGQFYAQGRRVKVDQVDPNLNKPEHWRFCPSCSYASRETDDDFNRRECPRCGHSGYADQGQVKEMARLRQVQATTEDARSRFGDDTDERNPLFFHRELLILPDHSRREISLAIADEEFPFGVEYLASTTFREINFGEQAMVGATHAIAGKALKVKGFELCRSCGKVQRGAAKASNHTWGCKYRDKPDDAQLRQLLFMYREFNSEALRFLLPGASFWDEAGQPSFIGALHLGLRQRFGGKVDHLQSALGEEPQPGSQQRKTFLYLFDSVPGGTGYVRQLIEAGGKDLREVFQLSLQHLQACSCSDGCYRCIFMYRQRFDRQRTSKRRAIEQLQTILHRWHDLQPSERSLSEVVINTRAESELELRFIDKLREGKGAPPGVAVTLRADFIKGNKGYLLTFTSGQQVVSWKVEQQVPLGEAEGVRAFSRADVLLTPTAGGKPIAIYTDGWEFHRSRLATDAEQRMALQRSGRYLFWALSWHDVVEATPTAQAPLEPNGLAVGVVSEFSTRPELFSDRWWPQPLRDSLPTAPLLMPRQAQLASSLQLLMAYLANPSEALWQGMAQQFCLAQASPRPPLPIDDPHLMTVREALQLNPHIEEWQSTEPTLKLGQQLTPAPGLQILNLVDSGRHHPERLHPAASFRAIHFEPDPSVSDQQQQAAWREWLRQGNLFQFLPHLLLSTPGWGGSEQPTAVDPPQVWVGATAPAAGASAQQAAVAEQQRAWKELSGLAPPQAQPLLEALAALWQGADLPLPEQAFELAGARGEVLAQAELAWPDQQLAVLVDPADAGPFTAADWRCWWLHDPPGSTAAAVREALASPCPQPVALQSLIAATTPALP